MEKKLQVIDFFCGAGGFSEGFRQQGFDIVMGIDNWLPAIETHNLNHNLKDVKKDVLDFSSSIEEIDKLPDTEIIIGSPPCVLFSLSNKGGKSDKTLGIKLIESFLRVVAVKKHHPSSRLVAWFMENVPNSKNYIKPTYTFRELGLDAWAKSYKINPDKIALNASVNGHILNTANFGASQKRERFVCGEIVRTGRFPDINSFIKNDYLSVGMVKGKMPSPNLRKSNKIYNDPNYSQLRLKVKDITDHFYDSGIYKSQWEGAKYAKINHPFMGKMPFPENENNPSRTIMATRSASTREAIIYKSEYKRTGDGEYRLPTIREIATLMGFPYSYQFTGGENSKWRQIGNAVCPQMSSALAKSVRISLGLKPIPSQKVSFPKLQVVESKIENLNTFSEKVFDKPPKKMLNARFRKHPFKDGNMTVALTNFNPTLTKHNKSESHEWYSSVFMGSGKDFKIRVIPKSGFKKIQKVIDDEFVKEFDKRFKKIIGNSSKFQSAYVSGDNDSDYEPNRVIQDIGSFIEKYTLKQGNAVIKNLIPEKEIIPVKQVLAMYAINRIVS